MGRGSCLCGSVAWETTGEGRLMSHCHCSMCRKSHGSAFGTYVGFAADGFRWLRGSESIVRYESSPGFDRPFCRRCGSGVAGDPRDDGSVFMPAGCLDDDPVARPQAHIFVASKAPWWSIHDDLPRYDAYPEAWGAAEVERATPSDATPGAARGSCLCGSVRYELSGSHERIFCCHCSRCRKARSAAHATNLFVVPQQFRWTAGRDRVQTFKLPDAVRFTQCFCRDCGAPMPRVADANVAVPAGSLDDDPGARPGLHIHVASMAPWYSIPGDALPRHREGPDSEPM
jgi:hypothetical protein